MHLKSAIDACNVCQVSGNRKFMVESVETGTLFIVPFSVSDEVIHMIAKYGTVLYESFCKFGDVAVCFVYVSMLIQSKKMRCVVCNPEYAKTYFKQEIDGVGIYEFNGLKLIVTKDFLSQDVLNEIHGK